MAGASWCHDFHSALVSLPLEVRSFSGHTCINVIFLHTSELDNTNCVKDFCKRKSFVRLASPPCARLLTRSRCFARSSQPYIWLHKSGNHPDRAVRHLVIRKLFGSCWQEANRTTLSPPQRKKTVFR